MIEVDFHRLLANSPSCLSPPLVYEALGGIPLGISGRPWWQFDNWFTRIRYRRQDLAGVLVSRQLVFFDWSDWAAGFWRFRWKLMASTGGVLAPRCRHGQAHSLLAGCRQAKWADGDPLNCTRENLIVPGPRECFPSPSLPHIRLGSDRKAFYSSDTAWFPLQPSCYHSWFRVDLADLDWVKFQSWYQDEKGRVRCRGGLLHRMVMTRPEDIGKSGEAKWVYFRNGNFLDCRSSNLTLDPLAT